MEHLKKLNNQSVHGGTDGTAGPAVGDQGATLGMATVRDFGDQRLKSYKMGKDY